MFIIFQMEKRGIVIKCLSLEGQLAKLELMGSGAFQLLQKILHPVSRLVVYFRKIAHFFII